MRRTYIHELPDWPRFHWRPDPIGDLLSAVRYRQGLLLGRMKALRFDLCRQSNLETMTRDVVATSEIEGETLDARQVRSAIARRVGMDIGSLAHLDRSVEGVVAMALDASGRFAEPLSTDRLFGWHASLFPTGSSGLTPTAAGAWRDDRMGPMQIVSGPIGRQRVHFQAPAASLVAGEMRAFIDWFNAPAEIDQVLRAGLAHLWFVTIHPFDDGNGRIARAVTDMALARSEDSPLRFYSMSSQIRLERASYYDVLERTQRGSMDVSEWMQWFLACLGRAIDGAETTLAGVLAKAEFWRRHADMALSDRQRLIINRLLDGIEGRLTSSRWARMARCSQDTALRDITHLVQSGLLERSDAGGRSTSYRLRRWSGKFGAISPMSHDRRGR